MSWPRDLASPPAISAQAETIRLYLGNYTAEHGGKVVIMQNPRHLWEEVFSVANKDLPRILVCYMGETSRGDFARANTAHRVDRQWTVTILRGQGFKSNIAVQVGETVPFLDVVETIRDGLRVMLNISEEFPIDYRSIQALPNVGPTVAASVFIDGYVISFGTANDIPAVLIS